MASTEPTPHAGSGPSPPAGALSADPPLPLESSAPPRAMIRVVNPVMKFILRAPLLHRAVSHSLMLISVKGRRTGRVYTTPVGFHWLDGDMYVPTASTWAKNLRGGGRVVLTFKGGPRGGRGELIEDTAEVAGIYRRLLDEVGIENARRLGFHVNEERYPTGAELEQAVADRAVVRITLDSPPT